MKYPLLGLFILLVGSLGLRYYHSPRTPEVALITGSTFTVSQGVKRVALLGCTPHPTVYLSQEYPKELANLRLEDFLDLAYLKDSFSQVLKICKDHQVDHLLIAYLPIYFVKMRQLLKERFVKECHAFLQTIAPQIAKFVRELKKELGITVPVTIMVPPQEALEKIPHTIASFEERIRYLIKQFPHLDGIGRLESILIINNKSSSSQEDDGIINYLQYEYLFEPPVRYTTCETTKKRFHLYKGQK